MKNSQKIKMALAYKGMSESELARRMGSTPQAFNQRMKTDKFTGEEMEKIGKILDGQWVAEFVFSDGTKV